MQRKGELSLSQESEILLGNVSDIEASMNSVVFSARPIEYDEWVFAILSKIPLIFDNANQFADYLNECRKQTPYESSEMIAKAHPDSAMVAVAISMFNPNKILPNDTDIMFNELRSIAIREYINYQISRASLTLDQNTVEQYIINSVAQPAEATEPLQETQETQETQKKQKKRRLSISSSASFFHAPALVPIGADSTSNTAPTATLGSSGRKKRVRKWHDVKFIITAEDGKSPKYFMTHEFETNVQKNDTAKQIIRDIKDEINLSQILITPGSGRQSRYHQERLYYITAENYHYFIRTYCRIKRRFDIDRKQLEASVNGNIVHLNLISNPNDLDTNNLALLRFHAFDLYKILEFNLFQISQIIIDETAMQIRLPNNIYEFILEKLPVSEKDTLPAMDVPSQLAMK